MNIRTNLLRGFIFCLIGLLVIANIRENSDVNAISMYFVVYGGWAIVLGIVNALYLKFLKCNSLIYAIGLGILPIVILLIFIFSGIPRLVFIGKFGCIGIGITNVIWIINNIKTENES